MSEHTPGPWKIRPIIPDPDDGVSIECAIVAADTSTVATVHEDFDADAPNNACLIAAAPDLLEAAIAMRELFWDGLGRGEAEQAVWNRLRAAITKALSDE